MPPNNLSSKKCIDWFKFLRLFFGHSARCYIGEVSRFVTLETHSCSDDAHTGCGKPTLCILCFVLKTGDQASIFRSSLCLVPFPRTDFQPVYNTLLGLMVVVKGIITYRREMLRGSNSQLRQIVVW